MARPLRIQYPGAVYHVMNRAGSRQKVFLEKRYKAIVVDKDGYLAQVVRYIHLNPVEAGLVREPQAYVWSSHRFYLRPNEAPKWLRTEEVMGEFGSIGAFHEFVLEGNEEALEEFYQKGRQSPVLGDEEFRERFIGKPVGVNREHPRHERVALRPSMDRVLKALAKMYGVEVEVQDLMKGKRGKVNEARKVGMYLAKELCDLRLQEIAERFGTGSYGAVGWACHGVTSRMESDARFRERVANIRRTCQQKI